jgi:O-antigen/teichoic acid export membrane protein
MALLYHSHIEDSADMLGLLMTGFVGIATTYIFGSLLTANGSIKELNYMAAGGMILNVVLNLILIPRYYALGSAVASMVTQIFTAVIQVVIAAYIFKLRLRPVFLFKMIAFISVVVILGILSSKYIENRAIGYFGMIGASMIFAFLTGLINLKNLYQIIAYKQ